MNRSLIHFVLFLLLIMAPGFAMTSSRADPVKMVTIKEGEGFSHLSIFSVFQGHLGFLWFGTGIGLYRYDGYDFKIYKLNRDLSFDILILAVTGDQSGNLWIGTVEAGLVKLDRETEEFTFYRHDPNNPNSLCSNHVTGIYRILHPGFTELWVGTANGLSRVMVPHTPGAKIIIKNYRHDPSNEFSLPGNHVTSLAGSNVQEVKPSELLCLWIGTTSGLSQLVRDHTGEVVIKRLVNDSITVLYESVSDDGKIRTLWAGTEQGLDCLNWDRQGSMHVKRYKNDPGDPNSLRDNRVTALLEDTGDNHQRVLWIGTQGGGLVKLDIQSETFENYTLKPTPPRGLDDYRVNCLYLDRAGILWAGTQFGGVNKVIYGEKKLAFEHFEHHWGDKHSLSHDSVRCIVEEPDSDGRILWVGTFSGGLNRLDRKTGRAVHFEHDPKKPHSISDNRVFCLHIHRSGTLWLGTRRGLDKLGPGGRFKHYLDDPANPGSLEVGEGVRAICEDLSGVLWIGTQGGGLHKFDPVNETFKPYRHNPSDPNSLISNNIYTIYETIQDGKQVLWIGTFDAGLNKFDAAAETFKSYSHDPANPDTISFNFVLCCYSSASVPGLEHILWIGTAGGGLNKFDTRDETFSHFTEKHGLLDLTVYGILSDSHHNLWMSTNKGIAKFNIRSGGFRQYSASDGLMGREFNGGAYYKNKKGEMFFGGVHGLNIFHPGTIYVNQQVPPIVVTVSKNFEDVPIIDASTEDRAIELSRDTHVISFEFAALDFLSPLQNQYAYKLEPLDKNWIYCGNQRTVNYPHLEPGRYVFRVKGSNNDNLWNEKGVSVKLRIIPAIWQTWWFKFLLALVAVILLFSLYRVQLIASQRKKLQRQVEERTREFKEASEKAREMALRAKQASESKSRFLANMSHEIRTPMAGIIGLTDLVLSSPLPQEQQQHLSLVKQSANHLMSILDDIMDISKIEAGQLNLNPVDFNFFAAVEEVRAIVLPQVKDKGLDFDWFIQNSIPGEVTGDRHRLKQILLNLLSNAVKFTDKGKIGVHIQQENESDTLRFSVSDTGIGIPLARQPHVFESFTQVDDSISRKYGGAGLGLAISRQLVEAMGGKIWFEDNPVGGTVFHFTVSLPVRQARPQSAAKEKTEDKELVSRLARLSTRVRLLLAEDNPINQKLAQALIKRTRIPLDTVGDGVAALEALKQNKYHLILMDIQMPEMDGLIATGKIRDEMGMKDIPIIALTAHAMKEDRQKCLAAGMNDYVTKPFKPNDLYHMLLKWL